MRLTELDPSWIMKDGKRVGFTFLSPTGKQGPIHWRQSCFVASPPTREQWALFGDDANVQGCTPGTAWRIAGGIENATFDTMSVQPSIDGSAGGLWHGFITGGEIR